MSFTHLSAKEQLFAAFLQPLLKPFAAPEVQLHEYIT